MQVWSCDFRENSGEGRLARLFVENLSRKFPNKINVISPDYNYKFINGKIKKKIKKKKINYESFYYKYIFPLIGCFYSWYYLLRGKSFTYVNYLPLWNFLIFITLAPTTNIGPITGAINFETKFKKILIKFLYKISKPILILRFKNIIFSTDNLKSYFKGNIKNLEFNFVLNYIQASNKKKLKKTNDVIIYYRKHSNKNNKFIIELVKKLILKNLKIICIGDNIENSKVTNLGFVTHKKSESIIKRSKIGINSSDNFYSFFMLDCLNNNTKVLCDKNSISEKNRLKKGVLISDYRNINLTISSIYNFIRKNNF